MARTFKRSRQSHPIADLNVTNLIDLGFTLLIIFMIATPLINQEQSNPINLPVAGKSTTPPSKEQSFENITITKDGRYQWGSRSVTFQELCSKLNAAADAKKQPVIRLRADADVSYQKVATILDELKKRGLGKIDLPTQGDR